MFVGGERRDGDETELNDQGTRETQTDVSWAHTNRCLEGNNKMSVLCIVIAIVIAIVIVNDSPQFPRNGHDRFLLSQFFEFLCFFFCFSMMMMMMMR